MSQASRWIDTHTWPVNEVPEDVVAAIRGAVMLPPTLEQPHGRARFPDGSELWKNRDGKFVAKDAP